MEKSYLKYIDEFSKRLIEQYDFKVGPIINDGQSYMIEYCSSNFVIKIDKYFREFYITLYKMDKLDIEVNLFNLLDYLKNGNGPKSDYFRLEKDLEECYKKQLNHISNVVCGNYDLITDFFIEKHFEKNMIDFEKYWKGKHPELFNQV